MRISLGHAALAVLLGCAGPSQVSFMNNEHPSTVQGTAPVAEDPAAGRELPGDEEIVEPSQPAVGTRQERALVHIHTPTGICSGAVLGPRLVATSQRCLRDEARGVTVVPSRTEYRIEIASSTLTWTNRKAQMLVLPACPRRDFDLAVLVLSEAVDWVQPLRVASAPGPGARVQALGFGKCAGETSGIKGRVGAVVSVESKTLVIDVPLCKGDVGGPVVDGEGGDVIGLISHRGDPEGSPRRTTTILRLDTTQARAVLQQADELAKGGDPQKAVAVACGD